MSNINIVNGELNINSQLTLGVGSGAGYLGESTYNVALGYDYYTQSGEEYTIEEYRGIEYPMPGFIEKL